MEERVDRSSTANGGEGGGGGGGRSPIIGLIIWLSL